MSGFSAKSYEYSADTTEWDDILVKKGIKTMESILEDKGLDFTEHMDKYKDKSEKVVLTTEEILSGADLEDLDVIEDVLDDERALQDYREARLKELREKRARDRYGLVKDIDKADWTREVNDASQNTWVIVHMFQDSMVECQLMDEALKDLAARFKYIKFVRIKSTSAVEKWPDRNLPTLFMYNEGEAKDQIMTLNSLGGKSMKPENLEWALVERKVITDSELEYDPSTSEEALAAHLPRRLNPESRHIRRAKMHDDDSDDDDLLAYEPVEKHFDLNNL